jgi:hypothetical protein
MQMAWAIFARQGFSAALAIHPRRMAPRPITRQANPYPLRTKNRGETASNDRNTQKIKNPIFSFCFFIPPDENKAIYLLLKSL